MELADRKKRAKMRFMHVMTEDMQIVAVKKMQRTGKDRGERFTSVTPRKNKVKPKEEELGRRSLVGICAIPRA